HNVWMILLTFDFCNQTGREAVVVEQTIVAVDGPMGEMVPRSLDIDDPIDVAFPSLTNSDFQCFHERSPRPPCARTWVSAARCLAWSPVPQSSKPCRDPSNEFPTAAPLLIRIDNEARRRRKRSAAAEVERPPTRRVLARPAPVLQQEYRPCR